jgi:hypothetical protein
VLEAAGGAISSDRTRGSLFVALYDMRAVRASKPVVVEFDPLADLGAFDQRTIVTARGSPSAGRAAMAVPQDRERPGKLRT